MIKQLLAGKELSIFIMHSTSRGNWYFAQKIGDKWRFKQAVWSQNLSRGEATPTQKDTEVFFDTHTELIETMIQVATLEQWEKRNPDYSKYDNS